MNLRLLSLIRFAPILFLTISAATASADIVYDNGSKNGTYYAWDIGKGSGAVTSDSFTVTGEDKVLTGLSFAVWLNSGDTLSSVEVDITSQPFGGTTFFDQVVNVTASECGNNGLGFVVCVENGVFNGPNLSAGTYWLNLDNAIATNGDPVGWDENFGEGCSSPGCPSMAMHTDSGTIPSEAFTLFGGVNGGTVPEPGSFLLFGTALAGLAAGIRGRRS